MGINSIRTKLLGGFLVLIVILIAVSGVIFSQLKLVEDNLTEMMELELQLYDLNQKFALNIAERSNSMRGFLLTGDNQYIDNFNRLTNESAQLEEKFMELTEEESVLKFIIDSRSWGRTASDTVVPIYLDGRVDEAISFTNLTFAPRGNALIETSINMAQEREEHFKLELQNIVELQQKLGVTVLIITGAAVILAIILAAILANSITKPITKLLAVVNSVANGDLSQTVKVDSKDELGKLGAAIAHMVDNLKKLIIEINSASEQVAASAEELMASAQENAAASQQVSASIQKVASGAEQQEHSINSTSDTITDMIGRLKQAESNSSIVKASSSEAIGASENGVIVIERAVTQIGEVSQIVGQSAQIITNLGVRSQEIGKIVEVITGIAEQTNLLALNAAIEAARAGEQGRGFAVVAEEVRKLAEQSATATKEISTLITEIQNETNKSVDAMNRGTKEVKAGNNMIIEAGDAFKQVLNSVAKVNEQIEEAAEAIKMVVNGSETVVEQTDNMMKIAKEASSSAQEVASITEEQTCAMDEISKSAQQLTNLSEELQVSVNRFKL
ncbi:MAG: methyl-accepting chemotaxis protein [Bacillota bacterium]|nr:methyl-accepting chemotaxis protein [Bacillota bacterium]